MTLIRLVLANAGVLVAAGGFLGWGFLFLNGYLQSRSLDDQLRAEAESAQMDATQFVAHPVFLQVLSADGVVVTRSINLASRDLPLPPDGLALALSGTPSYATIAIDGHQLRTYVAPHFGSVVEAAAPLDDSVPSNVSMFFVGGVLGVLGALVVAWVLARMALAPVETLAATVRTISTTEDLAQRVPVDVTRRRGAVARLAVDVNGMLARLQAASQQLRAALDSQRRFVADASHELRTPLTSIRGNAQLLVRWFSEEEGGPPRVSVEEVVGDMAWEAERMSRLVDGLLVLARADAEHTLVLDPTQLTPVLESALRSARVLAEDVDLIVGNLAEGTWVDADPDRLQQLVLILLDNAIRYSPLGGRVVLNAEPAARDGHAGVAIEVTDAGPGIPPAERARIFERFYRGEATRRDTPGSGLGLAVAAWIAAEHHATIDVRDAEPRGSTFSVWLPTSSPRESD